MRNIQFVPVYARGWQVTKDEEPQLFDIFIDGVWQGSRRTIEYCIQATAHMKG